MTDHLCGAVWTPEETDAARESFAAAGLDTSAESLVGFRDGETVCLWDAEVSLFGKMLLSWLQTIGTCVGMGMGRGMEDSIHNAIAFGDQVGESVSVAWEVTYAVARTAKDIGNGQMGSDPSGNYPAWFARAYHKYGVAIRKKYAAADLTTQKENLAAQWCVRGHSAPQEIVAESQNWPAAACYWPETIEQVLGCLRSGRGVVRAGNRATNPKRQANGYSGLVSSGGHCQCWRGVVVEKHGEPFIAEQQSWPESQAPHGPCQVIDYTGREIVLPQGVGLISLDDASYFLKNGEVISVECPRNLWRAA